MEKETILKKLIGGKNKDYTYTIAFFLMFSFFVLYVIKPNILSVFEANQRIEELKKINNLYESQIDKIIDLQTTFETNRDDFVYLVQGISNKPEVNKVLSDIDISSEGSKLNPQRITVSDINLKDLNLAQTLRSFVIDLNINGTFNDMLDFGKKIYSQRRLKIMKELDFNSDKVTSGSGNLGIQLKLEGYYL